MLQKVFLVFKIDTDAQDMLLMLDYGIFYEFIPMEDWESDDPKTLSLDEVEVGKTYAMVITTNAGLMEIQDRRYGSVHFL